MIKLKTEKSVLSKDIQLPTLSNNTFNLRFTLLKNMEKINYLTINKIY